MADKVMSFKKWCDKRGIPDDDAITGYWESSAAEAYAKYFHKHQSREQQPEYYLLLAEARVKRQRFRIDEQRAEIDRLRALEHAFYTLTCCPTDGDPDQVVRRLGELVREFRHEGGL